MIECRARGQNCEWTELDDAAPVIDAERSMRGRATIVAAITMFGQVIGCQAYDRAQYEGFLDASDIVAPDIQDDASLSDIAPDATDATDAIASDASTCDASAARVDPCTTVPALTSVPVIDGVLECGLALEPLTLAWYGDLPAPTDVTMQGATAWRPDGVYVFLSVHKTTRAPAPTTQPIWCADAAEIFIDDDGHFGAPPLYDDPGTSQFIIAVPVDAMNSVAQAEIYRSQAFVGAWRSTQYRAYPRPDGYDVEAFITASDVGLSHWNLLAGARIGFDATIDVGRTIPLDDADMCGGYLRGQFNTHVGGLACMRPSCDVGAFCAPSLAPAL